jgi:predicted cobalt transporter CbtA
MIGRGIQAGLAAGLVTSAFGFFLAEPVLDRAVALESARTAAENAALAAKGDPVIHNVELFSRDTQHVGFVLGVLVTAIALGLALSVAHAVARKEDERPWQKALMLAAGAFFGVYMVPFVRYPANPPGVGDPGTLNQRTLTYLAALVIGVVGVIIAARVSHDLRLRDVATSTRQLAVGFVLMLTLALPFALPANRDALDIPAELLWEFRLFAFAIAAMMWTVLGVTFGLLGQRAQQHATRTAAATRAVPSPPVPA